MTKANNLDFFAVTNSHHTNQTNMSYGERDRLSVDGTAGSLRRKEQKIKHRPKKFCVLKEAHKLNESTNNQHHGRSRLDSRRTD